MHLHDNTDPTRSKTLRDEYAANLRGGFQKVSAIIRRGVREKDALQLNQEMPVFRFDSDADKIDEFMVWMRNAEEQEILSRISRNDNTYVRSSYDKGASWAEARMREQNIPIGDTEDVFNLPKHQDSLQQLYTRNFEELQGITSEMERQISRELTQGFSEGLNPTKMSRNLTDRVDAVGKHRATLLARTEVINAHSTAALNRYEDMGIEEIGYQTEHITAGDRRVCPICSSLDGRTYTINEVRTGTFQAEGSTHARQPPIHPQCRCTLVPTRK